MQALKDDVTLDLGDEDAWMWIWFAGWTVAAGVIGGSLFPDATGAFGWQAFFIGAVVGAVSTIPAMVLFRLLARGLVSLGLLAPRASSADVAGD
ncbi:hypothetical protein [Demequina silvatica]|uniref:hypothetical protein n=1 Tax=Demequina silvatica TaxID=1638988 RepID=UPI000780CF3F|nr:hypothetical protein [Demequina silvatica]